MGFFSSLFGNNKSTITYKVTTEPSEDEKAIVGQIATRLSVIINESIELAKNSNEPSTKITRIELAIEKLQELKDMTEKYPYLSIGSLSEVENEIASIASDIENKGYSEMAERNESGQMLEAEGKIDEAIEQYKILIEKGADTPFCYRRLAIIYSKQKMKNEEIEVLRAALENIPQSNAKHYQWFKDRYDKKSG